MLFPNGLAGIYRSTLDVHVKKLLGARRRDNVDAPVSQPAE